MGNKPTRGESFSPDSGPISLKSSTDGAFGLGMSWKPTAVLSVLEALFRVPCLCECILGAQIDLNSHKLEQDAIYELQLLFDSRAKSVKGSITPADKFVSALLQIQSTTGVIENFDHDDPSHLYHAISHLIISSLPELQGIFYDRTVINSKAMKSCSVSVLLSPDTTIKLESVIQNEGLPRPRVLETTPVFVVTTRFGKPASPKTQIKTSSYSLSFPMTLNLGKLTASSAEIDRSDLVYHLHTLVAECKNPSTKLREVKTYYRSSSGSDPNSWYEMSNRPLLTTPETVRNLGSLGTNCCIRVLVYIQSDLSMMASPQLPISGTISSTKLFIKEGNRDSMGSFSTTAGGLTISIPNSLIHGALDGKIGNSLSLAATWKQGVGAVTLTSSMKTSGSSTTTTSKTTFMSSRSGNNNSNNNNSNIDTITSTYFASCGNTDYMPMEEECDSDDDDHDEDDEDDDDYDGDDKYEDEEEEEEDEEDDDDDDENESDFEGEEEDDEDYNSEGYDGPEYEESQAECQCPTCRRERDHKLREQSRLRSEKDLLEQMKREKMRRIMTPKTPGTRSVAFQPTLVRDAERIVIDGKTMIRDIVLQMITGMDGYSNKSFEELRFEDYYLESPSLLKVKHNLDNELTDRVKEANVNSEMELEENIMRAWIQAAERAWAKYTVALSNYNEGLLEQAYELFTLALRLCYRGPHSSYCYFYRAKCVFSRESSSVSSDLEYCISLDPNHAEAHYLLGVTHLESPLKDADYEKAEKHIEKANSLDPSLFTVGTVVGDERIEHLQASRVKAAHQRLVNAAEAKKISGNTALSRGAYTEAERLYSEAIEIYPDGEKSHIYYCNRAAARCEIAVRLDPNASVGCETLKIAIEDCDKSLDLQPLYTKAMFRKLFCQGTICFLQENLEDSLKQFTAALELDPTNAVVKQEVKKVSTAIEVR